MINIYVIVLEEYPKTSQVTHSLSLSVSIIWIVSIILIILSFFDTLSWLGPLGGLFVIVYVIIFSRMLSEEKLPPSLDENQEIFPKDKFWSWLLFLLTGLIMIFIVGLAIGPALGLLLVLAIFASFIIKNKHSKIDKMSIEVCIISGIIVALSIEFLGTGDSTWAIFMGIITVVISLAGLLVHYEYPLTHIYILEHEYSRSLKGFILGCLYSIPLALLNILGRIYTGDTWIRYWWQSFYSLSVGIAEEIWARLFLLSLIYILTLKYSDNKPRKAVIVSIIFSSVFHGFAHSGINPLGILIGSLIYGIPLGYLYLKRDFEHVVGFHFCIDFIRFIAAYQLL